MKHPNRRSLENNRGLPAVLILAGVLFLLVQGIVDVPADESKEDREKELEKIQERIKDVKSNLDDAKSRSEQLQEDLKYAETSAGNEQLRLKGLEEQINKQNERLTELELIIEQNQAIIDQERARLAEQIRAAYITGRSDYLKLLLNQENPGDVGRVVAYYDYYNRARTRTIQSIQDKLDLVNQLRLNIQSETEALENLKQRQVAKSRELEIYRDKRSEILELLRAEISEKGDELKTLEEHKKKLGALLSRLDEQPRDITFLEDVPPFDSLKGKLAWPVDGKLLNHFGSNRRGNTLQWQGVRIRSEAGQEVKAIQTGKVIFADWFRNLGLLLILDHGDGYMSLYGYNQSLLKKPGDLVLAGETIALVGDSGGQPEPAVYFEIRYKGKPVNPGLWCRK